MGTFEIKDRFYLNGKPFQVRSGSMHYFRTLPEYWRDRLTKLKAMGLNTVETYIAWNIHEPRKGEFHFEGIADVAGFVRLAQELGLYVILRPSPYICAEWEFGGFPGWLLEEDDMRVRTTHPSFMRHVEDYYRVLLPILRPLQITEGGNVILMQVENEYGSYGDEHRYMEWLRDLMREGGITVPLITSDGPTYECLGNGMVEGALGTANFGSRAKEQFEVLHRCIGEKPLMCTEFWVGWFDHWGNGGHMKGDLERSTADLADMMELGNFNIYMFEGGTNFGFMNGSNYYDNQTPDVTSYDYDAVLTEYGGVTEKYKRYREVIVESLKKNHPEEVTPEMLAPIPAEWEADKPGKEYGTVPVKEQVGLLQALPDIAKGIESPYPVAMEKLGQYLGYTLYVSPVHHERGIDGIRFLDANDRVILFTEKEKLLTAWDRELLEAHSLKRRMDPADKLCILTENMGRVNYGYKLDCQRKGLGGVQINGHLHMDWTQYPLPMDHLETLDFSRGVTPGLPTFSRFCLTVDEPADTFLELPGWGKGCIFINGFSLGRFWEIGPQKRFYVPAPLLKEGENEIIVFETEGKCGESIFFSAEPDLG